MKKLLCLSILLIGLTAFSQSWKKDLIFDIPLSESSNHWDVKNAVKATSTDTYNVIDRQGSGRRWLNFAGTGWVTIADADRYDVGTGSFSVAMKFTPANITDTGKYLVCKDTLGIGWGIKQTTNDIYIRFDDGTVDKTAIIGTDILTAGTPIEMTVVFSRTGSASLYVNRSTTAVGTAVISSAQLTLSNAGKFVIGNNNAHDCGFSGDIYMVRLFNYALTASVAVNYMKPEYPISEADMYATNANLVTNGGFSSSAGWYVGPNWVIGSGVATGNATSDNLYFTLSLLTANYLVSFNIVTRTSGTLYFDFGGGASVNYNIAGVKSFTMAHTTGTSARFYGGLITCVLDDVSVIKAGCVLSLNAEGMTATAWNDKINTLSLTSSGSTLIVPPASNLSAMAFNGTTSAEALTEANGLTGDVTISAWIRPLGFGENNAGRIIDNSKLLFYVNSSGYLSFSRDGSTVVNSGAGSIAINTNYHVTVTSTSAGVTNFYVNGVLSGTANQSAGTPVSGTAWFIGNNLAGTRTFFGRLSKIKGWNRILTTDQILQNYQQNE